MALLAHTGFEKKTFLLAKTRPKKERQRWRYTDIDRQANKDDGRWAVGGGVKTKERGAH